MEILIDAQGSEIVRADGHFVEGCSRKDTGHTAQPLQHVPCTYSQPCEIVAGCVAHHAIDCSAQSPARVVSVQGCTDSYIVGQLCGSDDHFLPKDFGEGPNFPMHVIENMHLDIGTHSVGGAYRRQLASNLQGTTAPHNAFRRLETRCCVSQANSLFGRSSIRRLARKVCCGPAVRILAESVD
jgi:hypothetical protein